jgi:Domain of unknown function (DUF4124)
MPAVRPLKEDRTPRRWPWVFMVLLGLAVGAFYVWHGGGLSENAPITVYKWQDADGNLHYADHAPPGVNAEAVQVAPGTIMPEPESPTASGAGGEGSDLGHIPKTFIDRAKSAGERLEEEGRSMTRDLDQAGSP